MMYLDTSALVKLVLSEPETPALTKHLADRARTAIASVTSELTTVEIHRTLFRHSAGQERHLRADALLARYGLLPLSPVLGAASTLPHRHLGTLDALHLSSAQSLGRALTEFITYDRQLYKIAQEVGVPVSAPGA